MRALTDNDYTYEHLVNSMGIQTLLQVDDNDYQGDSRVLVTDGHRYGLLFFGWGSCSGCDALQSAEGNIADMTKLRDDLYQSIHWENSAAALIAYIDGKDWTLDYDGRSEASAAFRARAREILVLAAAGREVTGTERKAIG